MHEGFAQGYARLQAVSINTALLEVHPQPVDHPLTAFGTPLLPQHRLHIQPESIFEPLFPAHAAKFSP